MGWMDVNNTHTRGQIRSLNVPISPQAGHLLGQHKPGNATWDATLIIVGGRFSNIR